MLHMFESAKQNINPYDILRPTPLLIALATSHPGYSWNQLWFNLCMLTRGRWQNRVSARYCKLVSSLVDIKQFEGWTSLVMHRIWTCLRRLQTYNIPYPMDMCTIYVYISIHIQRPQWHGKSWQYMAILNDPQNRSKKHMKTFVFVHTPSISIIMLAQDDPHLSVRNLYQDQPPTGISEDCTNKHWSVSGSGNTHYVPGGVFRSKRSPAVDTWLNYKTAAHTCGRINWMKRQ